MLNAIDLGCGAGGWAVAARGLPIRFVAVADIADPSLETWALNHFENHPDCGVLHADLSTPEGRGLLYSTIADRKIDLILGGIPCEQVSPARNNISLPHDSIPKLHCLIDGFFEIVARYSPTWWSIEDVLQIERHLPGPLFFGRPIPILRIQASRFGPQRRRRTFIGNFPRNLVPEPGPRVLREALRPGPYRTIRAVHSKRRSKHSSYARDTIRVWDPGESAYTITSLRGRHSKAAMVDTPIAPRVLEWQEAAVLQGFPLDFVFVGSIGTASKMIAQAISIHVGRAILQAICREAKPAVPIAMEAT
jgi:site-specific DNA-cytosine methylase